MPVVFGCCDSAVTDCLCFVRVTACGGWLRVVVWLRMFVVYGFGWMLVFVVGRCGCVCLFLGSSV